MDYGITVFWLLCSEHVNYKYINWAYVKLETVILLPEYWQLFKIV